MRFVIAGMLLIGFSSANAQDALREGARVRVDIRDGARTIEGSLRQATPDSLIVFRPQGVHRIARVEIVTVDVQQGRSHARGAGRGALIGLAAGTVLGLVAEASRDPYDEGLGYPPLHIAIPAVYGALAGTALGAIIGADRWVAVDLPRR